MRPPEPQGGWLPNANCRERPHDRDNRSISDDACHSDALERAADAIHAVGAGRGRHAVHRLLSHGPGGLHQSLRSCPVEAERQPFRRVRELCEALRRSRLLDCTRQYRHLDRPDSAASDGLGLLTALLLNREFPWRGLARALIIIPWALPSVVIALIWRWIYDPNTGVLNDILIYLSVVQSAVPWLADPNLALYAIIATLTWQGFPFFAVMILAGLQGIPRSHYEAASIDGASPWRQFVHITLPGIAPVLATAGLLRVIWVANSMDVIFVMTGRRARAMQPIPAALRLRPRPPELDFGYGTTIAVTFTILLGAIVAVYLARTMREVER
ncbi:ABC transporter permease subunit (plasmid) [Sinorhizobium meliloti]|nr:ABC transporter permease subunit [Sinorhizobium meliloti]